MAISEEIVSEYFEDKHNNALKVVERISNKLKIIFTMLSLRSPEPYWSIETSVDSRSKGGGQKWQDRMASWNSKLDWQVGMTSRNGKFYWQIVMTIWNVNLVWQIGMRILNKIFEWQVDNCKQNDNFRQNDNYRQASRISWNGQL